jgi:hypothetical protein
MLMYVLVLLQLPVVQQDILYPVLHVLHVMGEKEESLPVQLLQQLLGAQVDSFYHQVNVLLVQEMQCHVHLMLLQPHVILDIH